MPKVAGLLQRHLVQRKKFCRAPVVFSYGSDTNLEPCNALKVDMRSCLRSPPFGRLPRLRPHRTRVFSAAEMACRERLRLVRRAASPLPTTISSSLPLTGCVSRRTERPATTKKWSGDCEADPQPIKWHHGSEHGDHTGGNAHSAPGPHQKPSRGRQTDGPTLWGTEFMCSTPDCAHGTDLEVSLPGKDPVCERGPQIIFFRTALAVPSEWIRTSTHLARFTTVIPATASIEDGPAMGTLPVRKSGLHCAEATRLHTAASPLTLRSAAIGVPMLHGPPDRNWPVAGAGVHAIDGNEISYRNLKAFHLAGERWRFSCCCAARPVPAYRREAWAPVWMPGVGFRAGESAVTGFLRSSSWPLDFFRPRSCPLPED